MSLSIQLEETQALDIIKANLIKEKTLHTDETGININGKRQWLHNASSLDWTYLSAHEKRGHDAMDEMGILPQFNGVMCHDHWKPYYRYECLHSLCTSIRNEKRQNLGNSIPLDNGSF